MKVVVDTTVWSLFLRRDKPADSSPEVEKLKVYLQDGRAALPGIVRQELLSGIRNPEQFDKLSHLLEGFPDILATSEDHLNAARFFNQCRQQGIQGSPVDFLICALAHRLEAPILTTDQDFIHYAKIIPILIDF
ncbi:MAG: PIN domain-containing protein [Verrucomicrobiota bacterium]